LRRGARNSATPRPISAGTSACAALRRGGGGGRTDRLRRAGGAARGAPSGDGRYLDEVHAEAQRHLIPQRQHVEARGKEQRDAKADQRRDQSAFASAVTAAILILDEQTLLAMRTWLAGDLAGLNWSQQRLFIEN
jgi:hypothetical protein